MVVVDASVIAKWFDALEEYSTQAKALLKNHLSGRDDIHVPDLLLYEIANVWSTKTGLPDEKLLINVKLLEEYSLSIVYFDYKLIQESIKFSRKYRVSAYDAAYAVLAQEKKCRLITADNKFANQVKLSFVKILSDLSPSDPLA